MLVTYYDCYNVLNKVYASGAFIKQALTDTTIEELNRPAITKICYGVLDKDIALAAMKGANSSWGFRELPRDLQRDPDVLRAFVSNLDEDAREGILCRINLPNAVLQDDDFIRNIVDSVLSDISQQFCTVVQLERT